MENRKRSVARPQPLASVATQVVAFTTQRTPRKYKNTKPQGTRRHGDPAAAAAVHLDNGIGTTGESTIRSGISEGCGMHEPGEVQKEPLRMGLLVSFMWPVWLRAR